MTARLFAITAWLAAGHALMLGLFWSLLQVPESNVAMLVVSALVAIALVAAFGWVEGAALAAWSPERGWRALARRAAAAPLAAVVAVALFGLLWWLTGRGAARWTAHRGEIDAWLMLHLGWTRTAGIHGTFRALVWFIRWGVGASLALAIVAWTIERGPRALTQVGGWLAAALTPRRLVLVVAVLYGLVWLPWKAAFWRPAWIAPDWQEAAFVAIKLGVLYLVANLGAATILYLVHQGVRPASPEAVD